ncbi:MAG: matrixin family metalloprotease [Patescibacteria group bacterium]
MSKRFLALSLFLALLVVLAPLALFNSAGAKSEGADLPEKDGVYNVPNHSNLKLRVFVHNAKPSASGNPTIAPTLVCGSTSIVDPDSDAFVNGAGWRISTTTTWTYRLNLASTPATVGSSSLPAIAGNSFGAWLSAVNNSVSIVKGADTNLTRAQLDGQNIVSWGRTLGSALAVSYVWYYPATGLAAEVDTIMNSKFKWYWSDPNSSWPEGQTCAYSGVYDAQDIMTHEFGHTMGLTDEKTSAYVDNTMYGYGATGETKKDTLTTGDRTGVNALYQ